MKDSFKALYCKITAIVLAVIMVVLLVACFLPVVKVRTADLEMNDTYRIGRYTSKIGDVPEVELGIGSGINLLKNIRMASLVIKVQTLEEQIRYEEKLILEYMASSFDNTSSINACRERISQYEAKITEKLAGYTEEEIKNLEEVLLKDESFVKAITFYYGMLAMFDDTQFTNDYPDWTENSIHMLVFIFQMILTVMAVVTLVVYLVVSVINIIIKGIYFGVRFKNADDKMLDRLYPKALPGVAGIIFITLFMVVAMKGYGVALGSGVILLLVCYVLANAIRGISKILLADTIEWEAVIKFALTLIAILLIFAAIVCYINVGIFADTMYNGGDFLEAKYDAEFKKEYEAKMTECPCANCTGSTDPQEVLRAIIDHADHMKTSNDYAKSAAKKLALESYKKNAFIALGFDLVFMFVLGIGFISFVERLGNKMYKSKYSPEAKSYGAMPAVGILLIICFLVPNFLFTVPTKDARVKAYEEGSIKLLLDDYAVADTKENITYKAYGEAEKALVEEIGKLDTKAEDYAEKKEMGDRALAVLQGKIDFLETNQKSSLTMGTVWAVLIAASSFAYMFAVKPLAGILDKVFAKKSDGEEAPAEDTPAPEAPVEEAPADENTDAE